MPSALDNYIKAQLRIHGAGHYMDDYDAILESMKRARRKMRYFKTQVDAGKMTVQQVEQWLQGQIAYYENFDDHGRVLRLRRLFHAIFIGGANHV